MKRILQGAVVSAAALALTAAPALAAQSTIHETVDITGDTLVCGENGERVYDLEGSLRFVLHEGTDALGRAHVTGTTSFDKLVAKRDGVTYKIAGAQWFGFNQTGGGEVGTFTFHVNVTGAKGGVVDKISIQEHFDANGEIVHDKSTCES